MEKGHIRIKLTEPSARQLESAPITYTVRGIAQTSIAPLDQVNKKYGIYRMERTFPEDPRYEARHRKHGLHLWYDVYFNENMSSNAIVQEFSTKSELQKAEPALAKMLIPYKVTSYKPTGVRATDQPFNDPMLPSQWHYNNIGQTGGTPGCDIRAFDAWKNTVGKPNVIVSVHDQGVDVKHVDIAANMWVNQAEANGKPGVDDDGNGFIDDINGFNFRSNSGVLDAEEHGTHVAGTVAAVNNNGVGVCGVAGGSGNGDGARIMSVEILGGANTSLSYVYAADNGAVISQNSWGYTTEDVYEDAVYEAIKYYIAEAGNYSGSPMKGGVVIFASGNNNDDGLYYPAAWPEVIAVSATDPFDKKTSYSNFDTWVDISAPGGENLYGYKSSILSLAPKDKYAYMDGTSMACPHVSGVAALAVSANGGPTFTNEMLRLALVSSYRNIDKMNPEYLGKLGAGAIDALMATRRNEGQGPNPVTNLAITGIAQDFATLAWTAQGDPDDGNTDGYIVYYSTQPLTADNLANASFAKIAGRNNAGDAITYELKGLNPLTIYYFTVVGVDRWNNKSLLSNIITAKTNAGPKIAFGKTELNVSIDASVSMMNTQPMTILNEDEGLLRWSATQRAVSFNAAWARSNVKYPAAKDQDPTRKRILGKQPMKPRSNDAVFARFTPFNYSYYDGYKSLFVLGDADTTVTNSAAQKFVVKEDAGFNLTAVSMFIGHRNVTGPIILEIYKDEITPGNMVYLQEVNSDYAAYYEHTIPLNYQIEFKKGEQFWVVFHIPAGNKFPLAAGYEVSNEYSDWSLVSFNTGKTWEQLEKVMNDARFCWTMTAYSSKESTVGYIKLNPASGEVKGNSSASMDVTVDANKMINGTYESSIVVKSNDAKQPFATFPVKVEVTNQKPILFSRAVVDFNNVFMGASKTLSIQIRNIGYGNMKGISASIDNPEFELVEDVPYMVSAQNDMWVDVRYKPTATGNANGKLTLSDNDGYSYTINLTGVANLPSEITLLPESVTFDNLTIKEPVTGSFNIKNTGNYPLQYFIPSKADNKGLMDYNGRIHKFGYVASKTYDNFDYEDISTTGKKATEFFKDVRNYFYPVEIGFDFPFYNGKKKSINITKYGVLSFNQDSRFLQSPGELENEYTPSGMISATYLPYELKTGGDIFYQQESDKFIVQYNVFDEWDPFSPIEFQIVLHDNGDIEYKYKSLGSLDDWALGWYFAGIENEEKNDGIVMSDMQNCTYTQDTPWKFLIKYPGSANIDSVSNAKGTIAPNEQVEVKYFIKTDSLIIGNHFNSINIISNDPKTPEKQFTFNLNINKGGVKDFKVSTDTVAFGNVYLNDTKTMSFCGLNNGTEAVQITSITPSSATAFTLTGPSAYLQKAGSKQTFDVTINTGTLGKINEKVTFTTADGLSLDVVIEAEIVPGPQITLSTDYLAATVQAGTNTETRELVVTNTGDAPLTYTVKAYDWLKLKSKSISSAVDENITYTWKANVDAQYLTTDPNYNWIDITSTGTNYFETLNTGDDQWKRLDLPFNFSYYGIDYKNIYISLGGYISFTPQQEVELIGQFFPETTEPNNIIAPAMGCMIAQGQGETRMAVLTQDFGDYFVVQYNNIKERFGESKMNDIQIILYKTGEIKFQYRFNGLSILAPFSAVGLENQLGTEGCLVSAYQEFLLNRTAVCFTPIAKHILQPGATDTYDVVLDAKQLTKGTYSSTLDIISDAPGMKQVTVPVDLTVDGSSKVTFSGEANFGTVKAYKVEGLEGPERVAYTKDLVVENKGFDALNVFKPEIADTTFITVKKSVYVASKDEYGWYDIPEWDTDYLVKPGDKQMFRITLTPREAKSINTNIVIKTSNIDSPEFTTPLTADVIEPSVLSIGTKEIMVNANTATHTENKTFAIENKGKSDMTYKFSLTYEKQDAVAKSFSISKNIKATAGNVTVPQAVSASTTLANAQQLNTYNRTLQYENSDKPNGFLGFGPNVNFICATGFNAPDNGFNLSHVSTYYRWDANESTKIVVDILSGNTIASAKVTSSEEFTVDRTASDKGELITYELKKPIQFLSNERFWIAFTYPLGVAYPQGKVDLPTAVKGTFMFLNQDNFMDITDAGATYAKTAWFVRAHEQEFKESGWLTLSPTEGVVKEGESQIITTSFKASGALRGLNTATITAESNDPITPKMDVTAKLHLNDAPKFVSYPTESLTVAENSTLSIVIALKDMENQSHSLKATSLMDAVTVTKNGDSYTVDYKPNFESSGSKTLSFEASDEFGATRTLDIPVVVTNVNRAPLFIGTEVVKLVNETNYATVPFNKIFTDLDGDEMTYVVTSNDENMVSGAVAQGNLLIVIKKIGQSSIHIKATDINGGITEGDLNLYIAPKGVEDADSYTSMSIYPNPMVNDGNVSYTTYKEGDVKLELLDLNGAVVLTLVDENKPVGTYQAKINRKYLAPGAYLVKLSINQNQGNVQMVIVR